MRRFMLAMPMLLLSGLAAAQDDGACGAIAQSQSTANAVAPELAARRAHLGAPAGVLAQAYDQSQSVDSVLNRMRLSECRSVAAKRASQPPAATASTSAPAAAPVAAAPIDPATYKPKTKDDNTPWRFDMSQNGKRMTAEEFDAWMKARGVRVAKGAPTPVAKPVDPPAPADHTAK